MEETLPKMETKYCDNCKKDVPVQNYLHHSIHCPRNIRLCPKCDEPYPIIEMDAHIAQDHTDVVCPECYEFMEVVDLPSHQSDACKKRMVSCVICEVDLSADVLLEHIDYCGSRSDRCDGCGKIVIMKFRDFHLSTKHRLIKPETEAQMKQISRSFFENCTQISRKKPNSSSIEKSSVRNGTTEESRMSNSFGSSQSKPSSNLGRQSTISSQTSNSVQSNCAQLSSVTGYNPNDAQVHNKSFFSKNPLEPTKVTPVSSGMNVASSTAHVKPSTSYVAPSTSYVAPSTSYVAPSTVHASSTKPNDKLKSAQSLDSAIAECVNSIAASLKEPDKVAAPCSAPGSSHRANLVCQSNSTSIRDSNENGAKSRTPADSSSSSSEVAKSTTAPPKTLTAGKSTRNGVHSLISLSQIQNCLNDTMTNSINADILNERKISAQPKPINSASLVFSANAINSVDSAHPINPVTSANPINPVTSANPINPVTSANPINPVTSANSINPVTSANPINPVTSDNPIYPVTSANPIYPVTSANPINPVTSANPINVISLPPQSGLDQDRFRPQVLVPQMGAPKITPVTKAPSETRRTNFSQDSINEYMLRLEEHGLSNGLSSDSHSGRNSTKSGINSTESLGGKSKNVVKERAAEIRREREEGQAPTRLRINPLRSHITQAINVTQPTDLVSMFLAGHPVENLRTGISHGNGTNSLRNIPPNSRTTTDEFAKLYDLGLLPRANNNLVKKLNRSSMPVERTGITFGDLSRSRAKPSNFDALANPRPRRDHEVLTSSELRGLNETLELDRHIHNQEVEADGALCLPCEFCDAPIPMDHLILHQTGCRPDLIYH